MYNTLYVSSVFTSHRVPIDLFSAVSTPRSQVRFLFDQRIYNIIYYNNIILHGIPPLYIIDIYTPMYMFACSYTYYILYTLLSRGAQYALYTILYYIRDLLV